MIIYIKEAHPENGWILSVNRDEGITLEDPQSQEARGNAAQSCATRMKISLPIVIDGIENSVASAYGGWPDRLYLIGTDGRVAFQGEQGPFGFRPDELERAIERELAS